MVRKVSLLAVVIAGSLCVNAGGPHLEVASDGMIDMGKFEEWDVQTRKVFVRNTGDAPLVIKKAFTSCTCTSVEIPYSPIAPGDSAAMIVTYNGTGHSPGSVRKIVRLTSNADNPVVGILIKGEITPPFKR